MQAAAAVQWLDNDTLFFLVDRPSLFPYELWQVDTDGTGEAEVYTDANLRTFPTGQDRLDIDHTAGRVYLASFGPPYNFSLIFAGPVSVSNTDTNFVACTKTSFSAFRHIGRSLRSVSLS